MSQKILYLSCHAVLEHDEVKLFHELGYDVFSPGAYVCPENPGDPTLRPAISGLKYDPDILEQFHRIGARFPGEDAKNHLTKEFVDNFDAVVVMHIPQWIAGNWDAIKHKRVIWRTIGQSVANTEASLHWYRNKGIQIVRYSPLERTLPAFIGEDALIRFYKDPEDFGQWTGNKEQVVTFAQSMKQRDTACNYSLFERVTRGLPRALFGSESEKAPEANGQGKVPYEKLTEELRASRCYFYTGTHPASYTLNFMEAWMTGIPIVAIGPKWGNPSYFPGVNAYEVNTLIRNGVDGFCFDDENELRFYCEELLKNPDLASRIGASGRESAIRTFGKERIAEQWRNFLG